MLSLWRRRHPFWSAPHRPFFLLSGLSAALAPVVWFVPEGIGPEPVVCHRHELLFGAGGAALGGYLLTALPAWTGKGPVSPTVTRCLVGLWLASRIAFTGVLPFGWVAAASYFLALGMVLLRQVYGAGAWSRTPLACAPFALAGAELADAFGMGSQDGRIPSLALPLFFALLVSMVGDRAIPAFTRYWLHGRLNSRSSGLDDWMSRSAILSLLAAIAGVFLDADSAAGLALVLSAILQLVRMVLWRSWTSWRYPALMVLHLAWLWLPLGLALVGLSLSTSIYPHTAAALHALTMGAMGTMMLAIMGRAAMARSGDRLTVSTAFALAFGCLYLSVPLRLSAPFAGAAQQAALLLSAALWIAGWLIFVANFRHALRGEVRRPVLSARSAERALSPGG